MADPLADEIRKRYGRLKGDRGVFETHWQQTANYIMPERATYTVERTPGMKVMQYIFDETPCWAHEQFANGLHGFMTSSDMQWFSLHVDDDRVNADTDARRWLDTAASVMYNVFSSPRYTFAPQSHELYMDLGLIGTGVMAVLEGTRLPLMFQTRHLRECVIDEDEENRVDTLIRRFPFTARQALRMWGDAAGETARKAYEKNPDQLVWFYHRVQPRTDRDPQRADGKNKPFESVYCSEADGEVISESGFNEFPFMVPRFLKATGEKYGRSPGMRMLPAIKMLNQLAQLVIRAAQKVVDPVLMVPDEGYVMPLKSKPGGVIIYRGGLRTTDRLMPLETRGNLQYGDKMLSDYRQMVMRGFYTDWFIMPSDPEDPAGDGKHVSATYTMQQRQEKMRQASGMLARMQSEFLGPLIDRVFNILWRRSMALRFGPGSPFPAPPDILNGRPLRPEYVSPLQIAQMSSQLDAVQRVVQTALGLMQVRPDIGMTLDGDAILRLTAKDLNAPAIILHTTEEVAAARAQAQQQQAQQQAQEQAVALAKAGKDGSAAVSTLANINATNAAQGAAGAGFAVPGGGLQEAA